MPALARRVIETLEAQTASDEVAQVLAEAHELREQLNDVLAEVASALKPYEYPGVFVEYPDHCDVLLDAISSDKFTWQVGEPRNLHSHTSTPLVKWRKCNSRNRHAIARVRRALETLKQHPEYGRYRDQYGELYAIAPAHTQCGGADGECDQQAKRTVWTDAGERKHFCLRCYGIWIGRKIHVHP